MNDEGLPAPIEEDREVQIRISPGAVQMVTVMTPVLFLRLSVSSVTLFGQIIAGEQPVSAYQDWIDRYNAGPGPAIERVATRNWAHLVTECPS